MKGNRLVVGVGLDGLSIILVSGGRVYTRFVPGRLVNGAPAVITPLLAGSMASALVQGYFQGLQLGGDILSIFGTSDPRDLVNLLADMLLLAPA